MHMASQVAAMYSLLGSQELPVILSTSLDMSRH